MQLRFDFLLLLIILIPLALWAQVDNSELKAEYSFRPEVLIGYTHPANLGFPATSAQRSLVLNLVKDTHSSTSEWTNQLNKPRTGLSLAYIDFGNSEALGHAVSLMPFLELDLFPKKTERLDFLMSYGASYMNRTYDAETNPFNHAITTHLNWSFRTFIYYDFIQRERSSWKLGLGYFHHSNGHRRLPNQGLNAFLASISSEFPLRKKTEPFQVSEVQKTKSQEAYYSIYAGYGTNVLSEEFNDRKGVYTLAFNTGRIYNKTWKLGVGAYYRFYEHYFDYIENEEVLVRDLAPYFGENPFGYASCIGFSGNLELMLDHVGFEFGLGVNIYKPFYRLDWQMNNGFVYDDVFYPGELTWYYEFKRSISSRLGLKYYLLNTSKSPNSNLFIAAHLNANLGQADFSEISLGYVHRFKMKD
jgi:hypothetical protein